MLFKLSAFPNQTQPKLQKAEALTGLGCRGQAEELEIKGELQNLNIISAQIFG